MSDAITVIVPTRHRADYLLVTVPSILTSAAEAERTHGVQTRVLIVDDAPDDDATKVLADTLGVDYARVEVHDGIKDPGAAIVLGVSRVDTRFQCIFGDDDVMLPNHLSLAYAKLRDGADVVSSSFQITDENLVPRHTVQLQPWPVGDLIAGRTGVNDGSLVANDLVRDLEWDVTLEAQMLPPIWCELMLQGKVFDVVPTPTWWYRRHDENISHQALNERDQMLRAAARRRMRDRAIAVLGEVPETTPVTAR